MKVPYYRFFCPAVGTIALLLYGSCCAAKAAAPEKPPPAVDAAAGNEADHDAIRALVPAYEEAANQGKPELLKPYLDPEFSGVMITGDAVDSFASLEGYWAKIQKLMGEGGKYHVKVNVATRSVLSGDLAVARGTTDEEVTTGAASSTVSRGNGRPSCANGMANGKSSASRARWTPSPTLLSWRP